MSEVISYAVGNGDMFSIKHNSDNFTIIDCCINDDNDELIDYLKSISKNKGISRFISTHPDLDHFQGITKLDEKFPIHNFYCVKNNATKADEHKDFDKYCSLRDGDKAFYIEQGSTRKWMNVGDDERGSAGINILWPDTNNADFKDALDKAAQGESPNNISPIITYTTTADISYMWMGDLEADFIDSIADQVDWPNVDILFAPHHGRESGKIPENLLTIIDPKIIVIGEAPSKNLNYYNNYHTITQNSSGYIIFEAESDGLHIYVGSNSYSVDYLTDMNKETYKNYLGSLSIK